VTWAVRRLVVAPAMIALAVYPEAKVEVSDKGLVLYPSRPPVSKEKILAR